MSRVEKYKKKKKNKRKKIVLFIFIIIIMACIGYLCYYLYDNFKTKEQINLNEVNVDLNETANEIKEPIQKTERMLQLEELQKENDDIVAWLEIEGTNINYPILQAEDNDFYLNHNYKKETVSTGSLFLDKDFDVVNGSDNYLIYGHRNKNGLMFEDLFKYSQEQFYNAHKRIKFTTTKEDVEYEVLAVFYSRVYYKSEKNVFRYYFFVNAENEAEYDEYVNNCKKASIYDTGVTAEYGDQLITLSTCEYSQKDGRFVVVYKKVD